MRALQHQQAARSRAGWRKVTMTERNSKEQTVSQKCMEKCNGGHGDTPKEEKKVKGESKKKEKYSES